MQRTSLRKRTNGFQLAHIGRQCIATRTSRGSSHRWCRPVTRRAVSLKIDGIGLFVFASKETDGMGSMLAALVNAGWIITASWPIDTEMGIALRAQESARLHLRSISSAGRARIPTVLRGSAKSGIGATCCRSCRAVFTNGCRVWLRKASSARTRFLPVSARPWKFFPAIRAWRKPAARPSRSRNTWSRSGQRSPRKRSQ